MAELYLLPCGCGQKVRVGKAEAGQAVVCGCGQRLNVPTLRGLRNLELAPAEAITSKLARPAWSPARGIAFSGGLAVAAVALLVLLLNLYYYVGAVVFSTDHSDEVIQAATQELDDFQPVQLLDEWNSVVTDGLGHQHTPLWIVAQESAKVYLWRTNAAAITGVIAALVAVGAAFFGRR
jgi:hypothetical protein